MLTWMLICTVAWPGGLVVKGLVSEPACHELAAKLQRANVVERDYKCIPEQK